MTAPGQPLSDSAILDIRRAILLDRRDMEAVAAEHNTSVYRVAELRFAEDLKAVGLWPAGLATPRQHWRRSS